jgi:hypothetical protein
MKPSWIAALGLGFGLCGVSGCLFRHAPAEAPEPGIATTPNRQVASSASSGGAAASTASREAPPSITPRPTEHPPQPADQEASEPAVVPTEDDPPPPRPTLPDVKVVLATPPRPDPPLLTALRALLEKHPSEEVQALLDAYDAGERELLNDVLRLAVRLSDRDLARATPQDVTALLSRLESLERALRPRAALVLEKLCFCSAIDNFGIYTPLDDGHAFRATGPNQPGERVQVYAEVRNFTSRLVGESFETVLKGTLEIRDTTGNHPPITYDLEPVTDRSRTPRRDFFVNFHFDVPPRLLPGSYTLWVQVKDITPAADGSARAPRVARRSLDFRVVGDTR